jgi:hypothetical protein
MAAAGAPAGCSASRAQGARCGARTGRTSVLEQLHTASLVARKR